MVSTTNRPCPPSARQPVCTGQKLPPKHCPDPQQRHVQPLLKTLFVPLPPLPPALPLKRIAAGIPTSTLLLCPPPPRQPRRRRRESPPPPPPRVGPSPPPSPLPPPNPGHGGVASPPPPARVGGRGVHHMHGWLVCRVVGTAIVRPPGGL